MLVRSQVVLQQGIAVAVVAVLGNLHVHGRTVERNAPASCVDEVLHGIEGTHIVVYHHAARVHAGADAVVEHYRHVLVDEVFEVVILLRVLSLRHDDATHFILVERAANLHLTVVTLVTLSHHDRVAMLAGILLDA